MKKFLIQVPIIIFAILFSNIAFSQNENEYLKERTLKSQIVVEGKVISKYAFWDTSESKIFTDNRIEVFKVFKGRISKDTISIITKGGIMEDHFLILSHHPDFSVGMEGIFFCDNNNFSNLPNKYSTQLKIYGGEDSFIRYYNDGVNPAAADKKRTYKNVQSELYPALQLFSKQKIKTVHPNSQEQQINDWLTKSGIQVGLNKSPDNSPESPETEINIEFEFSNVTINSLGELDFDIMAKTNTANILLGEASVFVVYNPSVFGSDAVSNNVVEVTKGTIIQDSEYQLSTYDFDDKTVQVDAIGDCEKEANLYLMALEFEQFCHVKISISDWTQLANVSFDELKMDGSMKYFDSQRNECVDFDDVIVSDPINTFSSSTANTSIEYNLRNVEVTNSGGDDFLEFDITGKADATGTLFSFAEIFMNFNTSTFGANVTGNGNLLVFKSSFLNSNYSALYADESGGTSFGIDIVSINTTELVELPTTETELVHVQLKIQNCNTLANINFDEVVMLTGSTHFVGNGMPIPHEAYFPVTAEDEINSALCPANIPVILNFYPKVITAGTKSVLTIEGNNFGSVEGEVMFQNADDGGMTMMKALSPDFLTSGWSDSKIQLYVPSIEGSTNDPAGSGNFVVQTSSGTPVTSPLPLDIPYAVGNFRNTANEAIRFEMIDDNGIGGYTFHRSANMSGVNATDISNSITWALDEWNCETGVTWNLDASPSSNTSESSSDGINLIYFAPDSEFSGDAVAFNSASGVRTDNCMNAAGERVEWFIDVDIAIKQSQTWNFPLGSNPGMNTQDFPSVILHELGHSHRLKHAIPREKVMFWMLDQNPPTSSSGGFQVHQDLHQDDIKGGIAVLNSSQSRINGPSCNSITPIKILKTCITGIKELENDVSFINVYPNPVLDDFQLELGLKNSIVISVEVFDILGRLVHIEKLGKVNKGNHSFSIRPQTKLTKGTYLVNVKGDNQFLSTFKIVKL